MYFDPFDKILLDVRIREGVRTVGVACPLALGIWDRDHFDSLPGRCKYMYLSETLVEVGVQSLGSVELDFF